MAYISKVTLLDGSTYNIKPAVIDSAPVKNSSNPVSSGGVYTDQQRQEAEIGVVANVGAKNIVNNTADASRVVQGITWTKNSDGSMTANGTTTGHSTVRVLGVQGSSTYESAVPIPKGTYIVSPSGFTDNTYRFVLGFFSDSSGTRQTTSIYNEPYTFTVTTDTAHIDFTCMIYGTGKEADNLVYRPMIRRAEITDDTYVPYAPSNRELYENVGAISDIGAKNFVLLNKQSSTVAGVQFVPDTATGIVTATGSSTSSSGSSTWVASSITLQPGTYIFSASESSSWSTQDAYVMAGGTTIARDFNDLERFTITEPTAVNIYCRTRRAVSEAVFKPMIRRAEIIDDTFVPYAPTNRELYSNIFGSGTPINSGVDLDTLKTAGRYYIETVTDSASLTNNPCADELFYMHVDSVNGIIIQTIWSMAIDSASMYRRICKDNTWRPWFKFEGTEVST